MTDIEKARTLASYASIWMFCDVDAHPILLLFNNWINDGVLPSTDELKSATDSFDRKYKDVYSVQALSNQALCR